MCDTLLVLPEASRTHTAFLCKNSDREPDEAQAIVHFPRARHNAQKVRCTFIEIPQVAETYDCILSKPFQMWGAEMGVNEFGVAIGNEAVFTRVKHPRKNDGLTGMDLLRLALERSKTADEALDTITTLLEAYGQDACSGYRNKGFFYHNSFIIADPTGGWILETAGREWAASPVHDIASISNRLIQGHAERYSPGAKSFAQQKGWWNGREPFDFQKTYSDWLYTWAGRGRYRQTCTLEAAAAQRGQLNALDGMRILQTHNLPEGAFTPRRATTGSICMHRTSLLNPSDTTGSMVAELRTNGRHTVWLTGTSHPCLSVFIPIFPSTDALDSLPVPGDSFDGSLWWKAQRLHRWIDKDYINRKAAMEPTRQALQKAFLDEEHRIVTGSPSREELTHFSRECLQKAGAWLDGWLSGIKVED